MPKVQNTVLKRWANTISSKCFKRGMKRVGYTKTKTLRFLYEKGIISKDERNGGYTVLEYMDTKRSSLLNLILKRQ